MCSGVQYLVRLDFSRALPFCFAQSLLDQTVLPSDDCHYSIPHTYYTSHIPSLSNWVFCLSFICNYSSRLVVPNVLPFGMRATLTSVLSISSHPSLLSVTGWKYLFRQQGLQTASQGVLLVLKSDQQTRTGTTNISQLCNNGLVSHAEGLKNSGISTAAGMCTWIVWCIQNFACDRSR